MAAHDNTYSRAVALLKVLLPVLALAILSTLFLLSRRIEPSQTLPYADVDAREFAREQRIGSPDYTAVTSNGTEITVTADSARPDLSRPSSFSATNPRAEIRQPDDTVITIASASGDFDTEGNDALLTGGVEITSSTGYRLTSSSISARLDGSRAETDQPVLIEGPGLRIEAQTMQVTQKSPKDRSGGHVVVFNGGVRLIYTPQNNP